MSKQPLIPRRKLLLGAAAAGTALMAGGNSALGQSGGRVPVVQVDQIARNMARQARKRQRAIRTPCGIAVARDTTMIGAALDDFGTTTGLADTPPSQLFSPEGVNALFLYLENMPGNRNNESITGFFELSVKSHDPIPSERDLPTRVGIDALLTNLDTGDVILLGDPATPAGFADIDSLDLVLPAGVNTAEVGFSTFQPPIGGGDAIPFSLTIHFYYICTNGSWVCVKWVF